MIRGNKLHDDLFNHEAVDLDVEGAVALADSVAHNYLWY